MKCMSCGANIPPEWKGCLERNECPACLKEIMNDSAKELLAEIAEAMKQMPNDPQGLAGWLLSNYKVVKVGSAEPSAFFYDERGAMRQQPGQGNSFLDRSDAKKVMSETQAKLAEIKARQKKAHPNPTLGPLLEQMASDIIEEEDEIEYELQQEYEDDQDIYEPKESMAKMLAQNSGSYVDKNIQELDPELLNALTNSVANSGAEVKPGFDSSKVSALEEHARLKRLKAQQALRGGGFKGSQ